MLAPDLVLHGQALERNRHHVLARLVHRLGDGMRHFARLAIAKTDATGTIADYRQRRECEMLAAFDRLRHAIEGDQLFLEIVVLLAVVDRKSTRLNSSH